MKKALVIVAAVVALLAAAGAAWCVYSGVDAGAVPQLSVEAQGQALLRGDGVWNVPVFGGMVHKEIELGTTAQPTRLEDMEVGQTLQLQLPQDTENELQLLVDGEVAYSGPAEDWLQQLHQPGEYILALTCTRRDAGDGYGWQQFFAEFTVQLPPRPTEPELALGTSRLLQGEVLVLQLRYLPEGVQPTGETALGMCIFTPMEHEGDYMATVPVGNRRAPGEYTIEVTAGEYSWQRQITVEAFAFDEQDLTIDVTDPVISEANSAAAYQQYRETIPPLFATYDQERYWDGVFIKPVQGDISTPFGAIRYTNGDYANPSVHSGLDIKAAEGTEVQAPNAGRVVLAEYLLNTGNTIVIEHGGGLKSYYYHMNQLDVQAGQMVEKGDVLGQVGTTGYSTGPHLHFEMRIGDAPISPTMLFEETAALYSLPTEEDAP